jgi:Colicin immunity protein / pyocin immunity protein
VALSSPADLLKKEEAMFQELSRLSGIDPSVLSEHLRGTDDRESLLERISRFEKGDLARSDDELVALVQRIIDAEGSEAEQDEWLRVIGANVPAPIGYVTDLIFYPEEGQDLSAREVVERAKRYAPRVIDL